MSKRVCPLPSETGHRPLLQGSTLCLRYLRADSCMPSAFLARLGGGTRHLRAFPTCKVKMPLEEQHINHTKFFYVLSTVGLGHLAYHSRPQVASILVGKSTSQ